MLERKYKPWILRSQPTNNGGTGWTVKERRFFFEVRPSNKRFDGWLETYAAFKRVRRKIRFLHLRSYARRVSG